MKSIFVLISLLFVSTSFAEQTTEQYCGALGTWTYQVAWKRALGVPQDEVIGLIGLDEIRSRGVEHPELPTELPGIVNFVYSLEEYEPISANIAYIALEFRKLCIKEIEEIKEKYDE